ncbi:alcohol dehydrogenase catalytic domain-containing protein (plasmid) [Nocardioides sp. R1-1]|uniref:alcohol dehydrogenase catalytic domain-containing protein n=1 Tax=Nocardioides sp. R1-1 TaxID=3383502 RepID=UPI0038CF9E8E
MAAAAVNPTDAQLRAGRQERFLDGREPPYIPGMDLAGTVLTEGVRWSAGDRVIGVVSAWRPSGGAQAELVAVDERSLASMPSTCGFVAGSAVAMNALTAWVALDTLDVGPDTQVAVLGAGGAVGSVAVEISVARGAEVLAIARATDRDWLLRRGAAEVLERAPETGRHGSAWVVVDATPGDLTSASRLVGHGGRIAAMRPYAEIVRQDLDVTAVFVPDHLCASEALAGIVDLVERGAIEARVAMEVTPERAADAHAAIEAGGLRGRPVIVF